MQPTNIIKTPEQVEQLKQNWLEDPFWFIEDTPGFENYSKELRTFRLENLELVEKTKQTKHQNLVESNMSKLGCNLATAEYIVDLEESLSNITERLSYLETSRRF